jgi:hypothetical protein
MEEATFEQLQKLYIPELKQICKDVGFERSPIHKDDLVEFVYDKIDITSDEVNDIIQRRKPRVSPKRSPRRSPRKLTKQRIYSDKEASIEELQELYIPELKQICKSVGFERSPTHKADLVDFVHNKIEVSSREVSEIINNRKPRSPRSTSRSRSPKVVSRSTSRSRSPKVVSRSASRSRSPKVVSRSASRSRSPSVSRSPNSKKWYLYRYNGKTILSKVPLGRDEILNGFRIQLGGKSIKQADIETIRLTVTPDVESGKGRGTKSYIYKESLDNPVSPLFSSMAAAKLWAKENNIKLEGEYLLSTI